MAGTYRGGACGRRQRPRPCRKGWLPVARPQGVAPRPSLSPARAVAPTGVAPTREVSSEGSNGCPRRWRAAPSPAQGSDGGNTVRVMEEG
ncbi:hypothetical protein BHE74_00058707 [Ensete ventricosum]|nr:hypothetical protein BHE74_00058707 [Ensete ventricosum]